MLASWQRSGASSGRATLWWTLCATASMATTKLMSPLSHSPSCTRYASAACLTPGFVCAYQNWPCSSTTKLAPNPKLQTLAALTQCDDDAADLLPWEAATTAFALFMFGFCLALASIWFCNSATGVRGLDTPQAVCPVHHDTHPSTETNEGHHDIHNDVTQRCYAMMLLSDQSSIHVCRRSGRMRTPTSSMPSGC